MTEAELVAQLRTVLADVAPDLDVASIGVDEDLRNDLGLDSMDFLNFVVGIGKKLKVEIPEADYGKVSSLSKCSRYVLARLGS